MMKRIMGFVFALICLAAAFGALADEKDLYIDQNIQRIFTSEDGLLSTSTQAVAQTGEGMIWIGGYGGLVRYDGKSFETFAYKHITRVSDLAVGEDGTLWIATSDKGLFRYVNHEFEGLPGSGEDDLWDVECLAFAPDGTLYMGTGSGLRVVRDDHIEKLEIPELENELVDKLICPTPGRLLCVTRSGCLFACDGEKAQQLESEGGYVFRSICYDAASGSYLAGTSGDEVLVLDEDLNRVDLLTMDGLSCINDMRYDASGALWLCADNGIAIYVDGSLRMQNLLMNNSVDKMMVDMEGNYWFVSSRQGVLEVSRSQFGDVSRSAGLDSMVVNAIQRIGDTLYIGHDSGLAAISATDFKKVVTTPLDALKNTRVRALLADSQGNLWIGTMKKGLFCCTPEGRITNYTSAERAALMSNNIRSIVETDAGILFSTDKGAYLLSDGEVSNVVDTPSELSFRILCAIKFGDTICLGTDGNGLYLIENGQIVRHLTAEDGLSSNVIMKAYWSDTYQGLWLVTGNDNNFLAEDGTITTISNFPSTNNLDLLIMENGDVWMMTGNGIYQTTEDSLLHDSAPKYLQYRRMDGLPYEVTPNSYQCMTDDTLYICGSGGVFSLQTDFLMTEEGDYQMIIDSVSADGQPIYVQPGESCVIDADVKRIDINAKVLTFQTDNPFVFYNLEGFDNGETKTRLNSLGDISYTNLNGGSYTFHFGIWDYRTGDVLQEITLPIVKRHPWYQKPAVLAAAIVLCLMLLAMLSQLVILIRSRRIKRALQKEYEQKEKLHLKKIAYKDYLTDLYNRNYLDVWNVQPPKSGDYPISFVSLDMNNLKKINDRYGHKNGDQLLCSMADLLKKHFAGEQYTVFRIGGDEFLILARGADAAQMTSILDRMTEEGASVLTNGIPVTFAYGICTQREGEFDFEAGLRLSDLEMLENKKRFHGRDE